MSSMKDVLREMGESKKQVELVRIDPDDYFEIFYSAATWAWFTKTFGDKFLAEACYNERMQRAMIQGEPVDYIPEDKILIMRTYDPGTVSDMRLVEIKLDTDDDTDFLPSTFVRIPEELGVETRYVLGIDGVDGVEKYFYLIDLDRDLNYLSSHIAKGETIMDADDPRVKGYAEKHDWKKHLERYRRAKDRVFM